MTTPFPGRERIFQHFPIDNRSPSKLTPGQIQHYNEKGYIFPLDVFSDDEIAVHRAYFDDLMERATELGWSNYDMKSWHQYCAGIYDMGTDSRILDYVQDLLGETVILWATHFFNKIPGDLKRVSWHQDAPFWHLSPSKVVTVWLAIDDTDIENGAMKFVPQSHLHGKIDYMESAAEEHNVLDLTVHEVHQYGNDPISIELKAGQISLHSDLLLHSSEPNHSNRRRCGLTMRFAPADVERTNPDRHTEAILCRGAEPKGHFRYISRPDGDRIPENSH